MSDAQTLVGASLEAIQDHYDLSNAFYKLWLDDRMIYSGAYYKTGNETLEEAQVNKLDHHLQMARTQGARRLLDIGCGWGAILKRATEDYGAEHAVGLTLSDAQAQYVRSLGLPKVEVKVENWQNHEPTEPYDSVISIGAFEHFAHIEYSESEKVQAYAKFFERCQDKFLKPNGYLSLQTFAYGSVQKRADMVNTEATKFLATEIFKETDPPHLLNIIEAIQGKFEIVNLMNDRLGYAETLREWMKRLDINAEASVKLVGEEEFLRYKKYLQYSFIGFKTGNLDLYRITLRRLDKPWKKKGP